LSSVACGLAMMTAMNGRPRATTGLARGHYDARPCAVIGVIMIRRTALAAVEGIGCLRPRPRPRPRPRRRAAHLGPARYRLLPPHLCTASEGAPVSLSSMSLPACAGWAICGACGVRRSAGSRIGESGLRVGYAAVGEFGSAAAPRGGQATSVMRTRPVRAHGTGTDCRPGIARHGGAHMKAGAWLCGGGMALAARGAGNVPSRIEG